MTSAVAMATVLSWAGAVTYIIMYVALSNRNQTMGFTGDFEAAAESCLRVSLMLCVAGAVGTILSCSPLHVILAFARGVFRGRAGKKGKRLLLGDNEGEDNAFRDSVLPGAYQLRRR
jgi:hypothetical protein